MSLPLWLTEKLASPPLAGTGLHAWLFSVARQLHAHMQPDAVFACLQAATANCGRHVSLREIRDAVNNSHAVRWERRPSVRSSQHGPPVLRDLPPEVRNERWPKFDELARSCRILDAAADGIGGLYDLWERSPVRGDQGADDWLEWLFPCAEWLCLATDHPATARSRRPEKWTFGPADDCGLVVPSPMTGPGGKGLDGRTSHRCLDNTGPRRWLVVEFDSGSIDEQAALHWSFGQAAPTCGWPELRLCVHSGKKSLHGWYGPVENEDQARGLMEYAVMLGADPATWNRCQLVRLPGGQRRVTLPENPPELPDWATLSPVVRQEVYFFHPTQCHFPNNFTAPGEPRASSHLHSPPVSA